MLMVTLYVLYQTSLTTPSRALEADGNIAIDWLTNNDMMANPSKFQFMTTEDSNVILTLRGVTI